eukprot:COSAG01_NODE_4503_length_4970_cov_90.727161_3_plen_196_part_00
MEAKATQGGPRGGRRRARGSRIDIASSATRSARARRRRSGTGRGLDLDQPPRGRRGAGSQQIRAISAASPAAAAATLTPARAAVPRRWVSRDDRDHSASVAARLGRPPDRARRAASHASRRLRSSTDELVQLAGGRRRRRRSRGRGASHHPGRSRAPHTAAVRVRATSDERRNPAAACLPKTRPLLPSPGLPRRR